jgi:hypothetical protein
MTPPTPPTGKEKSKATKESSKEGVPQTQFWRTTSEVLDDFNRDQQFRLAKLLAGSLGATISFPNAREAQLRNELVKATSQKASTIIKSAPAKPENAAMKGSPQEKTLREAQKNLRAKRVELGLSKESDDPRLEDLIRAVKAANDAFQKKKSEVTELLRKD